jgi:Protein of unknown function (DUF2946)
LKSRGNNIISGLIAIVALVVQLALSFGHVHADADFELLATGAHCEASAGQPCQSPGHHEDEDDCAICDVMSLAASTVLPTPAYLAKPVLRTAKSERLQFVQIAVISISKSFEARAPPLG